MTGISGLLGRLGDFLMPPARPLRLVAARRIRLMAALTASILAASVMLAGYYLTLGLLPSATAYPSTEYPVSAWAHRFDLAQFLGTLFHPPLPTPLTWWLGLILLFGAYVSFGLVYALLLAWAVTTSDRGKGMGFAAILFVGLALTMTIANGLHPAIMRNALPDTGLFLLGWSGWATLQLLLLHLLYGNLLGALYQRWTTK